MKPLAGQLRSELFLCADHRTLHITKHIGGSSVLHHNAGLDIHRARHKHFCHGENAEGSFPQEHLNPRLGTLGGQHNTRRRMGPSACSLLRLEQMTALVRLAFHPYAKCKQAAPCPLRSDQARWASSLV